MLEPDTRRQSSPQTLASGARVSVQEREAYPLVDEEGLDLGPGYLTSLSLQLVTLTLFLATAQY